MATVFNLPLSGPDGSTVITDTVGLYTWQAFGQAAILGNALQLDGDADDIRTTADDRMRFGPNNFVISFEVRQAASDSSGPKIILDQLNTNSNGWSWDVRITNGTPRFQVYSQTGGDVNVVTSSIAIDDGNWHTVVFRRENGGMTLYIDGVIRANTPDNRAYEYQSVLSIGGRRGANASSLYDFKGQLRNFQVDNTPVAFSGVFNRSYVRKIPIGWNLTKPVKRVVAMRFYPLIATQTVRIPTMRVTRGVPPWYGAPGSTPVVPTQRLRGRVMQRDEDAGEDYPLASVRVALFYRRLHSLIDIQMSDAEGYVVFENLMPVSQGYYAIAFDNDDGVMQNAVIWDRLTPEAGA